MNVNLDERKVDFELTTAPVNARRSKASDLPTPARLPRRRNKQADGKVTEETLEPSRQKKARAPSTESGDGAKNGGNKSGVKRAAKSGVKHTSATEKTDGEKGKKKKPSKRQKLNAKKNVDGKKAVNKKSAKKSAKKPGKKPAKKIG